MAVEADGRVAMWSVFRCFFRLQHIPVRLARVCVPFGRPFSVHPFVRMLSCPVNTSSHDNVFGFVISLVASSQ